MLRSLACMGVLSNQLPIINKTAKKTKKKGAKGSLLNLRKESIFASPATIDGKVGVTGSGAGMTGFEDRKKYKIRR